MLSARVILTKTNVLGCYYWRIYETPTAPLPDRGRPPRPERLRGRRGAAHLPAGGLEADPRPGGRAANPGVRPPRQAARLGNRAGQGGDRHRRADPGRSPEPAPRRRG